MRTIGALGTTILFLLFLTAVPTYSQDRDETRPEAKPSQQQEGKEKDKAAKPDARPHEENRGQEQPVARPQEGKDQERKAEAEDRQRQPDDRRGQPEASRPQGQSSSPQTERGHSHSRVEAQRGKRIPDQKFRASFGPRHTFRVQRTQIVNSPQPTVVYGGYSFVLVEPWPAVWAFDDVVYVDYVDDEYFLFDPVYPGIRIALVVVE